MSSIFVFPGQGAQVVGMGKDLYETNAAARAVFDEVDAALGEKLSDIIFNGPMEDLTLTANVQPAIMATSIAMLRASGATLPEYVAGHSLGEYTALCAAGALSVGDAAKLLRVRGNAMQTAVPVGRGLTAVILGLDIDTVREICAKTNCDVANDNSPGQVVISGLKEVVEATMIAAKEAGAKRAMPLSVSGAFHSPFMQPAKEELEAAINSTELSVPRCPVYQNVDAKPHTSPTEIKENLIAQLTAPVRWTETIIQMINDGAVEFDEFGPGNVQQGLIKKIKSSLE